jgi:antitoxin component of MazEF toxin-antitoxin module
MGGMGFDRSGRYTYVLRMKKKISKIGNSHGIIFDSTLMEMAHLKAGDEVNLEIHPSSGAITIMPLKALVIDPGAAGETAKRLIATNNELFKRLS